MSMTIIYFVNFSSIYIFNISNFAEQGILISYVFQLQFWFHFIKWTQKNYLREQRIEKL